MAAWRRHPVRRAHCPDGRQPARPNKRGEETFPAGAFARRTGGVRATERQATMEMRPIDFGDFDEAEARRWGRFLHRQGRRQWRRGATASRRATDPGRMRAVGPSGRRVVGSDRRVRRLTEQFGHERVHRRPPLWEAEELDPGDRSDQRRVPGGSVLTAVRPAPASCGRPHRRRCRLRSGRTPRRSRSGLRWPRGR